MDKQSFLSNYAPKRSSHALPDGQEIGINELTLEQRGKLHQAAKKDPIEAQALVVCMGCDLFTEKDIPAVKGMPGDLISDIADAVLGISGLSDEDAEGN
ncbi:MAG: hypothetical protein GY938_22725 [Ketobacter sp.]|nr:hypothetical protein [Ketobacter sp.]